MFEKVREKIKQEMLELETPYFSLKLVCSQCNGAVLLDPCYLLQGPFSIPYSISRMTTHSKSAAIEMFPVSIIHEQ